MVWLWPDVRELSMRWYLGSLQSLQLYNWLFDYCYDVCCFHKLTLSACVWR